jgi:hypothetical protein
MRVAVTGDLHLDPQLTLPKSIRGMLKVACKTDIDGIIALGDLGHGFTAFKECLNLLAEPGLPVGVIAGNHDLWAVEESSQNLWDGGRLADAVRNSGAAWLEQDYMVSPDGTVILGTIAWYDYGDGKRDDGTPLSVAKARVSHDFDWIKWDRSDIEFAAELRSSLVTRMTKLEADPVCTGIVLGTHVPLFPRQQQTRYQDWVTAYYLNEPTGEAVMPFDKLRAVLSAHIHSGSRSMMGPVEIASTNSDYGRPGFFVYDDHKARGIRIVRD